MMKKLACLCAGLCVLAGGSRGMAAQDMSGAVMPPPKVLVVQREWVKPGKSGMIHEKSESAFVNAFTAAKFPTHYLAVTSLSGKPRVLFMTGYPTFEAWEKDNHAIENNPTLSAAIDRASVSDGELLTDYDQGVFVYDPEISLRAGDVVHSRYFEISMYKIKPGHRGEWMELAKMYRDGFEKMVNVNWAVFESYYGADNGGVYITISRMTSLAEDDASMGDMTKFADSVGPQKIKKIRELAAACIDSQQTNLFEFSPKMSYAGEDWIKADPFWKPKGSAAAKKPAAATP